MYWLLIDVALDYIDQASQTVKKKFNSLKKPNSSNESNPFVKIAGIITLIVLLFYKLIESLFGWLGGSKRDNKGLYSGGSTPSSSRLNVSDYQPGERITGQDIFNAAVGGQAVVTSKFGADRGFNRTSGQRNKKHQGVDIKAAQGTQLYAPFDGVIENANGNLQTAGVGGRQLHIVNRELGIDVLYLHLSEVQVQNGQQVKKGDPIAKSGGSGQAVDPNNRSRRLPPSENAFAPHLHLQIRRIGREWEDPEKFVHIAQGPQFQFPGFQLLEWDGEGPDYDKLPKPETMRGATQTRETQLAMAQQAWELAKLVGKKLGVSPEIIWSQYAQETGYFAISKYHGDYNFGHMESKNVIAQTGGLYMGSIPVKPGIKDTAQAGYWFYNFETAEGAAEAYKMMFERNKWNVQGVTSGVEFNRRIQSREFTGTGYNYHGAVGDSIGNQYEQIRQKYFKLSPVAQVNSAVSETPERLVSSVDEQKEEIKVESPGLVRLDNSYVAEEKPVRNIFNSTNISQMGISFETSRRLQG